MSFELFELQKGYLIEDGEMGKRRGKGKSNTIIENAAIERERERES